MGFIPWGYVGYFMADHPATGFTQQVLMRNVEHKTADGVSRLLLSPTQPNHIIISHESQFEYCLLYSLLSLRPVYQSTWNKASSPNDRA